MNVTLTMETTRMQNNFFELFQLPITLPVDLIRLNLHYQQLQKKYHPDNYANVADSEKAEIMQKSATINVAYQILKDPIKAAEYRVSLEHIDIDDENQTIRDTEFLTEQFVLREQLDDIEQAKDWKALDHFYDDMNDKQQEVYVQLLDNINHSDWQTAKKQLYRLRYLTRLLEQIELLQEKQFDL